MKLGDIIAFIEGNVAMIIGLVIMGDVVHIALLSFKAFILAMIGGIGGVIGKNLCELIIDKFKKK